MPRTAKQLLRGARSFLRRHYEDFTDGTVALSAVVPGSLMLFGIKTIPNIIETSLTSVLFSYAWVLLLVIGGLALLVGVLARNRYPTLSWAGEYVGLPGIIFGVLVYGSSAALAFGFVSGSITFGACVGFAALALKMWLSRRGQLGRAARHYDASGHDVAPGKAQGQDGK